MILTAMSLFVLTLSEDSSSTPDAKKGLNFGVPGSSSDQEELQGNEVAAGVVHAIPVASLGLSPILFGVTNHSGILAHVFVPPGPQSC